ncbi:hypothetical protein DDZ13_08510 [Coraliomargarita sinensis]|uniref:Transmembrane protein (PGPGW) n=1 Tax=Coraliomargarita sinensis TaxID=2174842 RepID=A0A317ZL27_9BACT|nr:PGPGW domain-containing protein [Coraliomargarita sinensis]PXA04071.1 hypothetical protein DDZ13_08510 [Coraliomargarita sinensis]
MDWLKANEEIFTALGLLSVFLFLLSLIIFPLIIIYLPHDYFVRTEPGITTLNPLRMVLRILKNALGCFLIIAGFLMLFLPGQGLLCLFLGISLVNFPGKRNLEMRLLGYRRIQDSVAWVRQKANRKPIILPEKVS